MEKKYIIAIDQSTTGTKALLIDNTGTITNKCYCEHRQILPKPGWVEHDPMELLANVNMLIEQLLDQSETDAKEIAALAITNQRETVVAWDKTSGKPVYHAIVWQCNRASAQCRKVRDMGLEDMLQEKTGLPLSEYYSGPKLGWIMDNVPEAALRRDEKKLLCGTIDSWLIWNLSEEHCHVSDYSNASRTAMLNLDSLTWNLDLAACFGVTADMLPSLCYSDQIVGHCLLRGERVPIAGIIGDSHGALFAQCGGGTGIKVTYGTGSSIMMGIGTARRRCNKLASTVAYAYNGSVHYAIEGNINSTGATINWVSKKLNLIPSVADAETEAMQLNGNGGVYFVPAFSGLGAPYWEPEAKGMIYGLSLDCDYRHVVRAALESIAYQICDVVTTIEQETGITIDCIRVDGKPTTNHFLMMFQSAVSGKEILKNGIEEASAYGSALLAGLAVGIWKNTDISQLVQHKDIIKAEMPEEERKQLLDGWHRAVKQSIG